MTKSAAILVHGFNVFDSGRATVDTLAPFLQARGITPLQLDYGWFGLLQAKFRNASVARKLYDTVIAAYLAYDEVYVIGHSNGCAIADRASKIRGFRSHGFVYINPALHRKTPRDECVKFIHVWHSPSDIAVRASRWLPFTESWGVMGAVGYQGKKDDCVKNFDKQHDYLIHSNGHSDIFEDSKRPFFGPLIVTNMLGY